MILLGSCAGLVIFLYYLWSDPSYDVVAVLGPRAGET